MRILTITLTRTFMRGDVNPKSARDSRRGHRMGATAVLLASCLIFMTLDTTSNAQTTNWEDTKELVRTRFPDAPQLSVAGLARDLAGPQPPLLIDVREPEEYAVSHLPGAVNARGRALERLVREVGAERSIVLYCSVGYRSARATEKLHRKGFDNVANLEGSIFEWANAGKPLVRGGPESEISTGVVHPFDDEWGVLLDAEHHSYVPRAD